MAPTFKTVLTYDFLIAQGIADNPLPVMRFDYFRQTMPPYRTLTAEQQREYRSLSSAASRARKLLTPEQAHAYILRGMQRAMGVDPGPPTPEALAQAAGVQGEPDSARRARLLAMDLRRSPRPAMHRVGDRSAEAQAERALRWQEWHEAKQLQAQAQRAEKAKARDAAKVLRVQERTLKKSDPCSPVAKALRREVLAAQCDARYRKPWYLRCMEDLACIAQRGRAVPRAERHPLARVPLYDRPHHPAS